MQLTPTSFYFAYEHSIALALLCENSIIIQLFFYICQQSVGQVYVGLFFVLYSVPRAM